MDSVRSGDEIVGSRAVVSVCSSLYLAASSKAAHKRHFFVYEKGLSAVNVPDVSMEMSDV